MGWVVEGRRVGWRGRYEFPEKKNWVQGWDGPKKKNEGKK